MLREQLGGWTKAELQRLRHRVDARYEVGVDRVRIDHLMSPLRYDISVRSDYFEFFVERERLFETSFDAYLEEARRHAYYVWFTQIHCGRLHPRHLRDPSTLEAAFARRVQESASLYKRVLTQGLDAHHRIVLHSGDEIEATDSGKWVDRAVYMGDGCHRVALLRMAGHEWLEPWMYLVRRHKTYRPIDNTSALLESLSISPREYFEFLSIGYGTSPHPDKGGLVGDVLERQPERFNELLGVISVDEGRLRRTQVSEC